jgi:hypothetical protein
LGEGSTQRLDNPKKLLAIFPRMGVCEEIFIEKEILDYFMES